MASLRLYLRAVGINVLDQLEFVHLFSCRQVFTKSYPLVIAIKPKSRRVRLRSIGRLGQPGQTGTVN